MEETRYLRVSNEELNDKCQEMASLLDENKGLWDKIFSEPMTEGILSLSIEHCLIGLYKESPTAALSTMATACFTFGFKYCLDLIQIRDTTAGTHG